MKRFICVAALACVTILPAFVLQAQSPAFGRQIVATAASLSPSVVDAAAANELRLWDGNLAMWTQTGVLQRVRLESDPLVAGRSHERLVQYYRGVPVFGAHVTRQINEIGQTESIFGVVHPDITLAIAPTLTQENGTARLRADGSGEIDPDSQVTLVVLPTPTGYRLTWNARVVSTSDGMVRNIFVDAATGDMLLSYDDTWTQSAVGRGTGVVGDTLKVSAETASGGFSAVDRLRPGLNTTYDFRGDPARLVQMLAGQIPIAASDIATDTDNAWTDRNVVAAHAYGGLTYDYLFRRFGRRGIDDQNRRLRLIANPAKPEDVGTQAPTYPIFFNNAAYYGNGYAVFGVGSSINGATTVRNFGGAIDVVAHEIAHGVTQYSSNLIYLNESGALNEAFSDIIGLAVEFEVQPAGTGVARADWQMGEDVAPSGLGLRSAESPFSRNAPDHYSIRFTGTGDNGGVHINSSIVNHMFYLSVMGGTHRLSGQGVDGVGFANRAQMERVIYRGFMQLLPANASFSMARAATIQAARDLFGAGNAPERAVTQAWTAVGVQ
jgi:bacillolysin